MSIKNLTYYLCMLVAVSTLLFTSACKGDDEVIIDDVVGINVGDGWYMAATGVDPVAGAKLSDEVVEEKDFGSQERTGFLSGYVWLDEADYNLVQVTAKEITSTIGGTAESASDEGSSCNLNEYTLATETAVDGAAITVATAGLYKVSYDETVGEMIMYKIESPNLIGSGTPGGWGADTEFTQTSLDASGGAWQATEIELRQGEWKLRFNCRWNLDRRTSTLDPMNVELDPDNPFDPAKGYMMFTNLGGSANDLVAGGANIVIDEASEGIYTVDVTWDGSNGKWGVALTKTADVAPITFVPDENEWALTGSATPNGWADDDPANDPIGVDIDMNYSGVDAGTYTWIIDNISLVAGAMKFRANDAWDKNMGCTPNLIFAGQIDNLGCAGEDITVIADQSYMIVLTTSDDGETYTANFTEL